MLFRNRMLTFFAVCVCVCLVGCGSTKSVIKPADEKYASRFHLIIDDHIVNQNGNGTVFVETLKEALSRSFKNVSVSSNYGEPKPGELVIVPQFIIVTEDKQKSLDCHAISNGEIWVISPYGLSKYTVTAKGESSIYLPAKYIITWPINIVIGVLDITLNVVTDGNIDLAKLPLGSATQAAVSSLAIEFNNQFVKSDDLNSLPMQKTQ
jgi:hypothetical protein